MQLIPTPIQLKSLPTRGILNNPKNWLAEKATFDSRLHSQGVEQPLWVVDNKQYDLTKFVEQHPGGSHWLERTRGQDIT